MRKALVVFIAVLACSVFIAAQDNKAEVFGGYEYLHANTNALIDPTTGSSVGNTSMNGWNGQATAFLAKNLGVTADFAGTYKTLGSFDFEGITIKPKLKDYTFMFGPTVRMQNDKITPFAHALFGMSHLTLSASAMGASASESDNSFAMALGGGLDVNTSKHLAIRIAQFDYLMTKHFSDTQNNFRYSAGVVFKF